MIAARMVDGLVYSKEKETIDEMDGELANIVNDFMCAVDVETLRLAKKSGTHILSQSGGGEFLVVSCRARVFAWAAETCGDRLQLGPSLYGRHEEIYSYSNHRLGDQTSGEE